MVYEGAPPAPGRAYQDDDAGTLQRVEALVAADDRDEALATFMREIVGMPAADNVCNAWSLRCGAAARGSSFRASSRSRVVTDR